MISVILWKEYREHRTVWIALAFLGAALLLGMPFVMTANGRVDPSNMRHSLCVIAVLLAWLYGMICGVMLLAGEREAGTLSFLDTLPGLRRRLWLAKCLAGLVLVLTQVAFLMAVATVARLFEDWAEPAWTFGGMVYFGLFGYVWGLLFSSFGRSVMNLILACFFGQAVAIFLGNVLANVVAWVVLMRLGIPPPSDAGPFPALVLGGVSFLTLPAALVGSAVVFTRLDRRRLWNPAAPSTGKPGKARVSWSVLWWLTWRQASGFAAGLALFAQFLGFFVLVQGATLWPLTTLLVGVLCGVTAFADEQEGPFRFLGDQRLPLGRFWLVKVGVRFAIAAAAALIVLAPSFFVALGKALVLPQTQGGGPGFLGALVFYTFHTSLILFCPLGLFLTVWLVYGFAAGCLCGILLRNGLAAGVFALFTSMLLTAVWVPSMLGGGLHAWQVFGPPVLLLLATRWLLRPWVAGRVASWTTAVRLVPFVGLALLWIVGALWYRVMEIPYIPEKADLDAFQASLPTPDQNEGGELSRRACLRFAELGSSLASEQAPPRRPGDPDRPMLAPISRAASVLDHGWNADDVELAAWLDKLFDGEWVGMLKKAADLPPGMFDDLRNLTEMSSLPATGPAREVAVVLAVHGLQRQAAGDDEAYVENLRIGLGLSRTMHRHAPLLDVAVGQAVQTFLVKGLEHWLEKLRGRPDLLRKALDTLSRHLDATAEGGDDQLLANDLIVRNTAEDPLAVLEVYLGDQAGWPGRNDPTVQVEAQWVALASLVPWERDRQARILRVMFWGDDKVRRQMLGPFSEIGPLAQLGYASIRPLSPLQQCGERAMQLKLALRWYQAENGRAADNPEELVPKYLKQIPLDPVDGRPFRYRLSKGEEIAWPEESPAPAGGAPVAPPQGNPPAMPDAAPPPPATRKIPPGQGILWCVGEDGKDDGGRRQMGSALGSMQGQDMIFLVPLPPPEK